MIISRLCWRRTMANSIISVTSQPDLNALISATKFGFLSKKKSMSIEVPTTEVTAVTAKLIEKDIDHQIWSIGPYGKLIFQETIDLHPKPRGRHSARNPIKYSAFGQSKSIKDWILDSRCLVSESTVRLRVTAGWDFTDAITKQTPSRYSERNPIKYEAFGESKSIKDWTKDPRCLVSGSNIRRRVYAGWDFREAITKRDTIIKYEAFGESKSIKDWTKDPRCLVSDSTVRLRVTAGWDFREAITKRNTIIKYEAFGELKSIKDWLLDPRCLVSESTIRLRVTVGWDFTDAITNRDRRYVPPITPPLSVPRYEAFGVSRTLSEWARSPLCVVARSTLRNRVGAGWSMEKALRTKYRVPKIKPAPAAIFRS